MNRPGSSIFSFQRATESLSTLKDLPFIFNLKCAQFLTGSITSGSVYNIIILNQNVKLFYELSSTFISSQEAVFAPMLDTICFQAGLVL